MGVALIEKSVFEDFVGFGESLIDIAEFQRDAFVNIAFIAVIMNARRGSAEGLFRVGYRC